MKKRLILGILLVSLFLIVATAYNFDSKSNIISVSGKGEISFNPDIAYVSIGVSGIFQDVSKGQKEVNDTVYRFLAKVNGLIPADNISTERLNINQNYEYISGKRQFVGYNIDQQLKIKLQDVKLIGKMIDLAVESGLNNIGQIDFSSSKLDEYNQKALKLSLLDAKKKAELIAGTMSIGKIKLKNISEVSESVQPLRSDGFQMKALAVSDTATQYQIGDMKVGAQVKVIYEF
ncbi:MAG: SIMPL domain-containing protein [Candidatus Riflemargulisbacteria bacterium]